MEIRKRWRWEKDVDERKMKMRKRWRWEKDEDDKKMKMRERWRWEKDENESNFLILLNTKIGRREKEKKNRKENPLSRCFNNIEADYMYFESLMHVKGLIQSWTV